MSGWHDIFIIAQNQLIQNAGYGPFAGVQYAAGAAAGGQPHEPASAGGADGGLRRHDHRRSCVQRGRHHGGGAALADPDAAQPLHRQPDRVGHHPVPGVHALHPRRPHPQQVGAGRNALQTGPRPTGA